MQLDHSQALLDTAAASALARIRSDRERAPAQLVPVLRYLQEHLFEPGFNVSRLKIAGRIRDNSFPLLFRQHVGIPPSVYIEDARLQTAVELMRTSELRISAIGDLVGYSSASVFSRAFTRWSGMRPADFCKADGQATARAGSAQQEMFSADYWRRALVGELDPAEAAVLRRRWRLLYPTSADANAHKLLVDGVQFEKAFAVVVWETIRDLSSVEQVEFVRSRISFRSAALFDFLLKQSRQEGRGDRQRGIQLAELALESLQGSASALGALLPDLSAKAWAWIGNARRLALDYAGAELAFAESEHCWLAASQPPNPAVAADLYDLKAGLRVYQRRLVEAAELVNQAMGELDRSDSPPQQVCRVLLRRALIADLDGRPADAVPDLQRAKECLANTASTDSHLELALTVNLATSLTLAERYEEAQQHLPRAAELCARHRYQIGQHQLCWLRGLIAQSKSDLASAEQAFQTAQQGFADSGETGYAAVISLDLAVLFLEQKRNRSTAEIAMSLIPTLEGLRIHREVLVALGLLRTAIAEERLSRDLLQQLQATLRLLIQIPRLHE